MSDSSATSAVTAVCCGEKAKNIPFGRTHRRAMRKQCPDILRSPTFSRRGFVASFRFLIRPDSSRAALAPCPLDRILPSSHARAASARVLTNRAAQSHLSILTRVKIPLSYQGGTSSGPSVPPLLAELQNPGEGQTGQKHPRGSRKFCRTLADLSGVILASGRGAVPPPYRSRVTEVGPHE